MQGIELLRRIRTAGYRAASPLERALLRLRGQPDLPPLWLRRHVGDPKKFRSAAIETMAWIERLGLLETNPRILDIGSGCGAMLLEFQGRLGESGSYVGFDVHAPSIRWAQKHWREDPRIRFETARIKTPYSAAESGALRDYQFPVESGWADFVLAKSVFTHMLLPELQSYLNEIRRVLDASGFALISFFLFDRGGGNLPAFPHFDPVEPGVRWRMANHPHAAVTYDKELVLELIQAADLLVAHHVEGFWPGTAETPTGQDQLVVKRK